MRTIFPYMFGAFVGVIATILALWLAAALTNDWAFVQDDSGQVCVIDWPREQLMSISENAVFHEVQRHCAALDVAALNRLILPPEDAVEISCVPTEAIFLEPNSPELQITITNLGGNPIHILEPLLEEWHGTDAPLSFGTPPDRVLELSYSHKANYIRTLEPKNEFTFSQPVQLDKYGPFTVQVVYRGWKVTALTPNTMNSEVVYELPTTCSGTWGAA